MKDWLPYAVLGAMLAAFLIYLECLARQDRKRRAELARKRPGYIDLTGKDL